jgi:multiple sugar transport system ATP-binding protein
MVFQSYALYPHLTIWENMLTPLRLRDLSFLERIPGIGALIPGRRKKLETLHQLTRETARTLQLEKLLDRKPGQLSGGQRQRVALGRAMVRKPKAFLMDEPLSNLDAALRVHMRAELAELHRKLGTTFIYVTHDQAEALTMSDRIAIMIDGQIIQLGTPDEIYKNPRDKRVAEFIGSPKINMLSGEVDNHGNIIVMGSNTGLRINANLQKVHFGVRPEHFQLINGGNEQKSWPFQVIHKENLGSDFYLHGHLNGSKQRIITRAKPEEVSEIAIGATLRLKAQDGSPMIFCDRDSRIDPVEEKGYGSA